MRRIVFPTLLLACLSACAAHPPKPVFGSFVEGTTRFNQKIVIDDVVKRMVAAFPPALTRLNLQHPVVDPFGTALLASLRARGYVLEEYPQSDATKAGPTKPRPAPEPPAAGAGAHAFAYVFDQPEGTDLYRVTLLVDKQALSRVYETKQGMMIPAGYWARKE